MEIRQAFPNEIGAIMTVIESARIALAEAGSSQWQGADGYPTEEIIFDDVLKDRPMSVSLTVKLFLMLRWLLMESPPTKKSMMEIGSIIIIAMLPFIELPF